MRALGDLRTVRGEGSAPVSREGGYMDGMDRSRAMTVRTRVAIVAAAAAVLTLPAALAATAAAQTQPVFVERPGAGRPGLQRLGPVGPAAALGRDGVRLRRRRQARPHARRRHAAGADRHRGAEGAGGLRDEPVLRGHGLDGRAVPLEHEQELGATPPPRISPPAIAFNPNRTSISTSEVEHVGAARLRRRPLGVAGHRPFAGLPDGRRHQRERRAPRRSSTGSTGGRRATRRSTARRGHAPTGRRARSA